MLKGLFQSKEDKIRAKIEEHLAEGMRLLSEKFFNGAMIEFDKAMELDPEEVYPRLVSELNNAASSGQLQAALAIGLNLIKENNRDYELSNKLGNFARELGDYKQAEGLYKTALKVNKRYEKAFYNLAACQARIDMYDDAVISALSAFDGVTDYILPEFQGDGCRVEEYTQKVAEEKKVRCKEKIQELTIERDKKIEEGAAVEAKGIDATIKKLKGESETVTPADIAEQFDIEAEADPENAKLFRYNKALYALKNGQPDMALKALSELSAADFDTVELLKAIALAEKGKMDEAIRKLVALLGENEFNRYNNVNLGLMYRKIGKKFLATKYLIKTAGLLDKSNGIYSMKALIAEADENFENGNLKKALNYYEIAVTELPSPRIWNQIGTINIERKKYDEAIKAFRMLLKMDPDSDIGESKLLEIHNYYAGKADQLMHDRKFKPACDYLHKALGVIRLPETLKKIASVYKQLNNSEKEKAFLEEYQQIIDAEKEREQEESRQQLIINAKQLMKQKNYLKAIELFETVFRMKVDKKVFLQLAALYKGLKKKDDLASLEGRWEKMVLHEEKMKKFAKDEARKQQSSEDEEG